MKNKEFFKSLEGGFARTHTVELEFTPDELKAIRRFYGVKDGRMATSAQVQRFVEDELTQSLRQVLDDYAKTEGNDG